MNKRTSDGKFVRTCANKLHNEIAAGIDCDIERDGVSVSKLSAKVRGEWAKENKEKSRLFSGLHSAKTRRFLLCKPCYNFFVARSECQEPAAASSSTSRSTTLTATASGSSVDNSPVKSVIEQLQSFSSKQLSEVAYFLGQSQRTAVKNDIKELPPNDVDNLCDLNINDWIESRNSVICAFLKGISTDPKHSIDESRQVDLAKAIEQIYYLQNKQSILPLSLSENLVSYAVARSKIVCNTNSSASPAGSHTYITDWLKSQAGKPLPPPVGDVLVAFDNDQVIGKTYHVRPDNKVKSSVITSVCFAEVQPEGSLQCDKDLKPGNWHTEEKIAKEIEQILDKDSTFNKAVDATHYKEVYSTLQDRLDIVRAQQILKDGKWQDHVDDEVARQTEKREWKVCWVCGSTNLKTKRVCVSCSANLNAQPAVSAPDDPGPSQVYSKPRPKPSHTRIKFSYLDIPSSSSATCKGVRVVAGEPIFVNPNSHSSVIKVFQEIGKQVNISKYVNGGCREWVAITCDGLPFALAQRVLKETFSCPICKVAVFSKKNYASHCKEHEEYKNVEETNLPYNLEFDWVVLRIGHGHFEMNMVRSFFKLNWEVFMKELAKCMGFCSDNAQKYAQSASDHHKAWEMLQILYLGSIDELVIPYVRDCIASDLPSTAEGYLRWSREVRSPRYQYLQEQMLTYASAIIHLRQGIRRNDMALVIAGRVKYAPVFHSRNHPKYQLIEMVELSNFLAAPLPLQEFLKKYQSISTSGDQERCEDMDFVLEAINKKSKSWTPKGVPTNQEWQRLFRNLEKFDKLRAAVFNRMSRDDPDAEKSYTSSHIARDEEVTTWRTCLRGSHFLDQPFTPDTPFNSVGLEKLDPQLVHLTAQATKRRQYFASKVFGIPQVNIDNTEPDMVFVTEAERAKHNDIRNQRKDVIATRILSAINALDDEGIKTMLLTEWESVKHKKREDFISFFLRVEEEVAQQEPMTGQDEAEEEN